MAEDIPTTEELRDLFYNGLLLEERDAAHNWMSHNGGRWLSYYKLAAQTALRAEVGRLEAGLRRIDALVELCHQQPSGGLAPIVRDIGQEAAALLKPEGGREGSSQ